MAVSIIGPKFYAWDSDTGKPLAFGKVYTYQAGTNTPKATFTTEGGETQNANPVILNGAGYADIYLNGSYKIVVKDADDVEVWTSDPVSDPSQLQQEWVRQRNITQVNTTTFTVDGELTDEYVEGVAVRVKQDSGFVTGTVASATYADGKTTVTLDFPGTETITASAVYAERALVSFQSLPKNLGDRTIYVGSVAESFAGLTVIDGQAYRTNGWHEGRKEGANDYVGDAAQVKSEHNGGTIISPTVPPVSQQTGATLSERTANYLAGVGETDPTGSGCFVSTSPTLLWVSQFGALPQSDFDAHFAFVKSLEIQDVAFFKGGMHVSQTVTLSTYQALFGTSTRYDVLTRFSSFTGDATLDVAGTECFVTQCSVYGGPSSDAIRISNGKICTLRDLRVKFAGKGVHLISGNSQRWYNVFAESNDYGFFISPDGGNNTNGCYGSGLRAFNSAIWGFYIEKGGSSVGHMHSTWDVSAEGGAGGISITGGRYCNFTLYSESNTGDNYDLDTAAPHYYFLKNPDSSAIPAFEGGSRALGVDTRGASIRFNEGDFGPTRVATKNFSASDSLQGTVGHWIVTNSSGSTRGMTLLFVDQGMKQGDVVEIYKFEDSPGFTFSVPAGYTIAGATGGLAFPGAAANAFRMVTVKLLDGNIVWIEEKAVA